MLDGTRRVKMAARPDPPSYIRRRYRLEQWLGQGSIGLVYRALDEALDRPVVIKFLTLDEVEAPGFERRHARFLREGRAAAHLSHPNIMAIYDMGQEQGWEYLVLEYIPGSDLRKLMQQRGRPAPLEEALNIADSVLQALSYAHDQGIIHRDIKPENILITPAGQVKVADFSLARGKHDTHLTQDGAVSGTLAYLAPEYLHGAESDQRADLYSLGVVLYELLTGSLPFVAQSIGLLLGQILAGALDPPSKFNDQIPRALEEFILHLLATDPEMRYASAAQALEALRAILAETPPGKQGEPFSASANDLTVAIESDRRQVAGHIQASIIDPLKLFLAQAVVFEQTLAGQPSARMAIAVLSNLARQVLQQANDLESSLRPAILESLGLEPALDALAERYERSYNLHISLALNRLAQRPSPAIELALYRLAQEVIEMLRAQQVTEMLLRLQRDDTKLNLEITFADAFLSDQHTGSLKRRIEPFGGEVTLGRAAQGQITLAIHIPQAPEMDFTERERQILQALVLGLSNKEIAQRLSLSPRTVNYHLDNIFSKIGVHSRTEAAVLALRHGWARRASQSGDLRTDPR